VSQEKRISGYPDSESGLGIIASAENAERSTSLSDTSSDFLSRRHKGTKLIVEVSVDGVIAPNFHHRLAKVEDPIAFSYILCAFVPL
jgi:hypothetical protein